MRFSGTEQVIFGKINSFLGEKHPFLGKVLSFWERRSTMRKKNYKGRCEKVSVSKSEDVCRLYSEIQKKYLDMLEENQEIKEIQCNVLLDGLEIGEYTSDFVCKKTGNHLMVRECVEEKYLMKPMTVKLLDASRVYWLKLGVQDWGLVIDGEE